VVFVLLSIRFLFLQQEVHAGLKPFGCMRPIRLTVRSFLLPRAPQPASAGSPFAPGFSQRDPVTPPPKKSSLLQEACLEDAAGLQPIGVRLKPVRRHGKPPEEG